MTRETWARRSVMGMLTALGGAFAAGGSVSAAPASAFQPARHQPDEWFDQLPGKHRVFIDTSSPKGIADGSMFGNNIFTAHSNAYGLGDSDVAMVICLRHQSAAFAFTDAIWSKYGKALADSVSYVDPVTKEAPLANPYMAAPRNTFATLAKRGVVFAICDMSTHRLSRLLAGQGGDADAMYKQMVANAIPNGRFVSAGVVALTHAQEYGYSLLVAG